MLQVIRDRAQGVFAWIIVGMISIPFALWGINSYFGGGSEEAAAEVDGVAITPRQVQRLYQRQRDTLAQRFGGDLPENLFPEELMKKQALQQLIDEEVLLQAARNNGMRVGNKQLAELVTSIDAFYTDGKFDNDQYERLLAQQGMTPRVFENRVRRDLLASQLNGIAGITEFALDSEIDAQLRLQQQQRDIGYMLIPVGKFEPGIEIVEADARAYYENNRSRYMQAERVKIDYIELKSSDLASEVAVNEEEVRQRYEALKLNFRTPEERRARHILITVAGDADEAQVSEALARAEALLARINNGEDFAELAKTESQDPGSARNGGDLGFLGQEAMSNMDKAFEEATFALNKGELSDVVRSSAGFHLIKLEDIKGGETKPYEAVAAELKREMQHEMAAEVFFDKQEQLTSLTYEQPDTLSMAAEQLALSIQSSDYFSRGAGTGIAADPRVEAAAFSEEVMVRGNNSEVIELGDNHLVVLRINDHQPEVLRPFEEVRAAIEASMKREQAQAMALDEATALYAKLQAGEVAEKVATSQGLVWMRRDGLQRDDNELDRSIVQAVFRMPRPEQGSVSHRQLTLPGGNQALLALYNLKPGVSAVEEDVRAEVAMRIRRANVSAAEQALIDGLRERAEITIKQ